MSKRMKLISEVNYDKLVNNSASLPKTLHEKTFFENEKLGSKILDLKEIPDDIKLQLYSKTTKFLNEKLSDLLNLPKRIEIVNPPEKETVTTESNEPDIILNSNDVKLIEFLPRKFIEAGGRLMSYLKAYPSLITWNNRGQCSFENSEFIEGSSITDLINFVLNPYQKLITPPGGNRFIYILRLANIPLSILGIKIRTQLSEISTVTLRKRRTVQKSPVLNTLNKKSRHLNTPTPSSSTAWSEYRRSTPLGANFHEESSNDDFESLGNKSQIADLDLFN